MKPRSETNPNDTWNLGDLYPGDKECMDDLEKIRSIANRLAEYRGHVTSSAEAMLNVFTLSDEMGLLADKACTYIRLNFDSDMGVSSAKDLLGRMEFMLADIGEKLAFLEPEMLALDPEIFRDYMEQYPDLAVYRWSMTKLFRQKIISFLPGKKKS